MKLAILSDFDDTAAQQNVAHLVLDRFSETDWRPLLDMFHQGSIKPKDYFEMPFRPITAAKHDMQAYVRETARLSPGFPELADFCMDGGIELAVVTYGLDFYVEALLETADLQRLPTYAVGAKILRPGYRVRLQVHTGRTARNGATASAPLSTATVNTAIGCTTQATAYPITARHGERTSSLLSRGFWTCASRRACPVESCGTSLTCSTI